MPFFTISNQKKYLIFTLKIMFWLVCKSYFFTIVWLNNILRTIVLLFNLHFFQSFCSDRKSISFQLYWSTRGLKLGFPPGWLLMFWKFNAAVKAYWKQLLPLFFWVYCFFIFSPFWEIYISSGSFQTYSLKMVIQ